MIRLLLASVFVCAFVAPAAAGQSEQKQELLKGLDQATRGNARMQRTVGNLKQAAIEAGGETNTIAENAGAARQNVAAIADDIQVVNDYIAPWAAIENFGSGVWDFLTSHGDAASIIAIILATMGYKRKQEGKPLIQLASRPKDPPPGASLNLFTGPPQSPAPAKATPPAPDPPKPNPNGNGNGAALLSGEHVLPPDLRRPGM